MTAQKKHSIRDVYRSSWYAEGVKVWELLRRGLRSPCKLRKHVSQQGHITRCRARS